MPLKSGDRVSTPDGIGIIRDFEIHPPLGSKLPSHYIHSEPTINRYGEHIRCGVKGCHDHIPVAYYPLNQINQDPEL